jgi:transposase InsO family protein
MGWAEEAGIAFQYIQPGKPQKNAYVERFNRPVRYEWLSQYYWHGTSAIKMARHHTRAVDGPTDQLRPLAGSEASQIA